MALPQPTIQYNPQPNDPLSTVGKLVSMRNLMQQGQIQQETLQADQLENQQRQMQVQQIQRKQQDQQTIQQAIAANPNRTLADILPSLQGKISQESWNGAAEADAKLQEQYSKKNEAELKNSQTQHAMYQQLYNGVMNLPDDQVQQNWATIAKQVDSVPGNTIKLDPAQPMTKAQLQQFGPFLGFNDAYLQNEVAKRKQAADATKAEFDAKKAQDEVSQIGKEPGKDVPYSPEVFAQKKALKTNVNLMTPNDAKDIADAIENGDQPPTLQGLYRNAGPVRAELARRGVPLAKMETDWKATQKYMGTLNGSQQVRVRQAVENASESLDKLEGLYNELQKLAPTGGFKTWNHAAIVASKNLPGRTGAVATALDAQIADVTSELGNVYMGGNSPTDHALGLAGKNLSSDWNKETFQEALKQTRANLKIRSNSINHGTPAGLSGDTNYFQPGGGQQQSSVIYARDPQGKLHQAPAGTALPAGWKQENK